MSSIRDCGESHKSTAEMLNDFLYENGKPTLKGGKPGILKQHTNEEMVEMLEHIRICSWESYTDIATEMGWLER